MTEQQFRRFFLTCAILLLTLVVGALIYFNRPQPGDGPPHVQPWELIVKNHEYDRQIVAAEGCVVVERTYPAEPTPDTGLHLTQYWLTDDASGPGRRVELTGLGGAPPSTLHEGCGQTLTGRWDATNLRLILQS